MTHTRDDVLAAIRAAFQERDRAAILAALDLYGAESSEPERERVQLAIIELSAGNREMLLRYVQDAKTDYRDVLAWKQLGPLAEAEGKGLHDTARALIDRWGKK
jgi:hypothetical protein